MEGEITFDEDEGQKSATASWEAELKPFFIRLVLSTKIVSTDEQAKYVLLVVAIFYIIIAVALPFIFGSSSLAPQTPWSASWPRAISQ